MCYVCVPCYMRKSGKNHEVLRESARRLRKKVGPHRQFPARAKGPDGIGSSPSRAPPRAAVLLPVALRLASPFASQIDAAAPASPFASQIDADKPALASPFASQIGPPPRPPTRAPPRAAVLLAAASPSPSRPSTPRSGQPRRRPSSVALGPKPTTCSRRGGPSPPSSCFRRPAPPRSRRRAAFILEPEVPRLPVPVNVLLEPGGERLTVPDSPPRSRRPRSPLSIRAPCLGD